MRIGRGPWELRPVVLTAGVLSHPPGSAEIRLGRTRVLCAATVDDKVPPHVRGSGQGWLTAEYGMLPAATHSRGARESLRGRPAGRTQEISRLIGRALRAVADLTRLSERTVVIDCDVLDADGGTRVAAITGAYVAAQLAVRRLQAEGVVDGPVFREAVAAVSVGVVDGQPLVDLAFEEDSRAEVDLNVVLTESGRLVEVQGTGEARPFTAAELAELVALARRSAEPLFAAQARALAGAWAAS
jgi:ribonuclease PH